MSKAKNKVESKFKNPDRFIQKLRSQLRWANSRTEYRDQRISELEKQNNSLKKTVLGENVFDWNDPDSVSQTSSSFMPETIKKLQVGKTVFMKGEISKQIVSKKPKENSVTMIFKEVYVKD